MTLIGLKEMCYDLNQWIDTKFSTAARGEKKETLPRESTS